MAETLLLCSLRWLIHGYIIPLLRSTFYVTETEFSDKRVLYYRKPVWSVFRSLSMSKLLMLHTGKAKATTAENNDDEPIRETTKQTTKKEEQPQYTEITAQEAAARLRTQQMGVSRPRLLPKMTGVRPIAMLCKREALQITEEITTAAAAAVEEEKDCNKLVNNDGEAKNAKRIRTATIIDVEEEAAERCETLGEDDDIIDDLFDPAERKKVKLDHKPIHTRECFVVVGKVVGIATTKTKTLSFAVHQCHTQ